MDAGERDKIDELLELTRDNNKILRSMHRRFVWSQVFSTLYWLVILGIAGWSYYFLQPYLEKYLSMFETLMSQVNTLEEKGKSLPINIQDLLDTVQRSRQ